MNLDDLFSTLHDFDIVGLQDKDGRLLMTLRIPWCELWDDFDVKIKVELIGGEVIACKYFEYTGGFDSSGQLNSIDKVTKDLRTIENLAIDIQRFESIKDKTYIFYCNGYGEVGGAELKIKADDYRLFDNHGRPIGVERYKSWHDDWWTKVLG